MTKEARGDWRSEVLEANTPPSEIPGFYSRVAPLYEACPTLFESRARRRILQLADVRDGEAIIEVGIGTGVQLAALAQRNLSGRTVGVDVAPGMLGQAHRRLSTGLFPRVELHLADARQLPFDDHSFDLVVNSYMLDLLPRDDIPRVLAEFLRVLRPGGRLVVASMTKGARPWHRFWDALYRRGLPISANCRGVLAAPVMQELGFVDIRREYLAQLLLPTEVVSARRP
jgi:ubiquinone/menaquinone biosynthesis C-methylase UbiE